jgi:hypothetical protein
MIIGSEIQSYRKATCNLVVLTFIKKTAPTGIRTRTYWVRSRRLIRCAIEAWLKKCRIFENLLVKLQKGITGMALGLKMRGRGEAEMCGA